MASTSPEHPHLRSRLESLPDVVLRKLLCHVAAVGRVALIQLARASPIIYKPAVTVAIQTAPADWHPVSVMTMGNFQVGRVLWRKTDVKDAVGRLVYAKAKSPLLYLVWADFLCDHPQRYFEVFGPIPPSQVHSLCILATTMPLVQATLTHARRVHLSDSSFQSLTRLDALGGFPPAVSSLTVSVDLFDFVGPSKAAAVSLLASLLTRSQVKSLRIEFTDSHRQSGHGSVVMDALEALLANGIPPTVTVLAMSGSFDLALNHLRSLPVAWPQSLQHVSLNLRRGKESGSVTELMLPSLATANLPLESLKLSNMTLDNGTTRDHVLACLVPSLLSFSLELSESTLDPLSSVHSVIHALSTTEAIVTPPDRPRPFAAAYLYTYTALQRESVFDLVVPHHEFFHGVSNWLTGGPSNSDCLSMRQAKGMGEGWSDMFALAVDMLDNPTVTRDSATPFAPYVMGNPAGMRTFPYTSDLTVNPSRYSFQGTEQYRDVHKFVEVWASMLWEVYWNLVDKYGCGPLERANLTDGNAL
ncbi:Fungalysin/Thermolysin Extracellular metalloproteinase 5 [Allomyces arbusculus]|nr:Fungalysin/Thermolysin Extracellular metalloproteinase 5 [Allomyces arbusculus]